MQKAFTIIFLASVIVWFLQTFDIHFSIVQDSKDSILAMIAGWISPIFKPLGFADWRISTSLITGFVAKESVVSTLTVLLGSTGISELLPVRSAVSLLVFCLLYTQCAAAIAAVKRELGFKWSLYMIFGQTAIAWIMSFLSYIVCTLFGL